MDSFLAQITMFGGNFAPRAWASCEGQFLPIAQNSAVFSLVGTIYGGDGRTIFALPDFRGSSPIHPGRAPGFTDDIRLGARAGNEYTSLNQSNLPSHNHTANTAALAVSTDGGNSSDPSQGVLARPEVAGRPVDMYDTDTTDNGGTAASYPVGGSTTVGLNGGGQNFSNRSPSVAVSFIFCLQGIFPSRS